MMDNVSSFKHTWMSREVSKWLVEGLTYLIYKVILGVFHPLTSTFYPNFLHPNFQRDIQSQLFWVGVYVQPHGCFSHVQLNIATLGRWEPFCRREKWPGTQLWKSPTHATGAKEVFFSISVLVQKSNGTQVTKFLKPESLEDHAS